MSRTNAGKGVVITLYHVLAFVVLAFVIFGVLAYLFWPDIMGLVADVRRAVCIGC